MQEWPSEYPCGVCAENCIGNGDIACDICNRWFHKKCERLSNAQFKVLDDHRFNYVCSNCSSNPDKTFNFDLSLDRLSKAVNDGNLMEYAKVEQVILRNHKINWSKFTFPSASISCLPLDQVVKSLLGPNKDFVPITTTGDGYFLFNALSIALTGNESLAKELRVRSCLELALNKWHYVDAHKNDSFESVADNIEDAIVSCATANAYSCAWTMHGAASVIGRTVRSVFPSPNSWLDEAIGILNVEFNPRYHRKKDRKKGEYLHYVVWIRHTVKPFCSFVKKKALGQLLILRI